MSSYLSIYIKPKTIDQKILIYSFSSNSDIYQFFNENNLSGYIGIDGEAKYYKLNKNDLDIAYNDLIEEISKDERRLSLMKELKDNVDINEILSWQEYIDEKKDLRNSIDFIRLMISEYMFNEVEDIYTNIG